MKLKLEKQADGMLHVSITTNNGHTSIKLTPAEVASLITMLGFAEQADSFSFQLER